MAEYLASIFGTEKDKYVAFDLLVGNAIQNKGIKQFIASIVDRRQQIHFSILYHPSYSTVFSCFCNVLAIDACR